MTYEELLDQIQGKGQSWSQWDLETARKNPSFGASMLTYKQDWAEATDQAGRTAANQAAEALRRQYGSYLGGPDGSKYYGLGGPGSYQSGYQDRISEILDEMNNYRDFDYGPAPTYNNRYQETLDELLGQVQNYGPFTWSKEEDPAYSAYAKQYRREGQRATADAMAQAAALTGGQVSTAAATAASQAGDYYAGQLADVIPQLYENAYQRYLSDYSLLADQLGQVRQAEQLDYAKYLDELGQYNADRNLSYDQWLQGYNMLSGNLSAFQGQDQTEYGRLLDQIEYNMQQDALDREAGGRAAESISGTGGRHSLGGRYALRRPGGPQRVLRRVRQRPAGLLRRPGGPQRRGRRKPIRRKQQWKRKKYDVSDNGQAGRSGRGFFRRCAEGAPGKRVFRRDAVGYLRIPDHVVLVRVIARGQGNSQQLPAYQPGHNLQCPGDLRGPD